VNESEQPADPLDDLERRVQHCEALCLRFEEAWHSGQAPRIEDYLPASPEPDSASIFRYLLAIEVEYRAAAGEKWKNGVMWKNGVSSELTWPCQF
jgi:hypothetical protein